MKLKCFSPNMSICVSRLLCRPKPIMSNLDTIPAGITIFGLRATCIQGAAEKSNSLTCFANSLATDYNFLMKLCIDIVYSYLHVTFKCYLIILKYDKVM